MVTPRIPMAPSDSTPRILVVDDNAENRALAQATLDDEGYEVVLATSGEDGIQAFQREAPNCVLLDVRMPGMDGFQVCARIRELPGGPETPIIFLTALRDLDTFDRALRSGADDFLTKPVRPTELLVRVQAALKLHRMSSELREHYDLVRHQRDDLMRLQLQKERLTAFVVHDLKNPVNSMDLHAQFLLRDPSLSAEARDSVRHIRDEARSLLRLVLNLLDISKSEEGRLEPRLGDVDLEALTATVAEALEVKAQTAGVVLERELSTRTLVADSDLLRRVLENLLDNALRHAPENTRVRVTSEARNGFVEIEVADSGPGISREMQEKIFERFVQVEAGERLVSRTGRGLGLAFCKLAVEAQGGTITVRNADPGAVFSLRLPVGK